MCRRTRSVTQRLPQSRRPMRARRSAIAMTHCEPRNTRAILQAALDENRQPRVNEQSEPSAYSRAALTHCGLAPHCR
jgi:hypothetical protein